MPSNLTAQDRELVAQYDDLKFLKLSRPKQQEDKLQNALKRDVKGRQDHGAADYSTTGASLRRPNFRTLQALGARLKELRRRAGLSQEELGGRAGLHWTYLSDLERGRQTPTLDLVNRLARALDVTLAEFFAPLDQPYRLRFRKRRRDLRGG